MKSVDVVDLPCVWACMTFAGGEEADVQMQLRQSSKEQFHVS